jgi:hypothetical protein
MPKPVVFIITKKKHPDLTPGNYRYLRQSGDAKKRLHLRIENDGKGVLLVNANRIYHFNPSATLMARLILEDMDDKHAIRQIARIFSVKADQAAADLSDFKKTFLPIISPLDDPCPICDLNLEILEPFSQQPSAPYRMDLALTYRCNNRCVHCYNEASRAKDEYTKEQWFQVLDKSGRLASRT